MECYGGGSIVGAIFGTIIGIALLGVLAWWIYKKFYCKHCKDPKLFTNDDPENAKHEFAFDNPAFKGDGNKSSPLNTNWTSPKQQTNDKRKPLDDSYAGMPAPRLVSLKGSDFTGLGIECYGGLKDGIFVKKVAPQGPASGHINIGDRITSLTIDFRHIVQEDAMTILSYASPYNVQLELVNGNNTLRSSGSSKGESTSPKPGRQSPLVHPLVRSSSQSDLNTIERNSRKKFFNNDNKDYPTLKMDKNVEVNTSVIEVQNESGKKSPSLMQQFKNQIAKIEEKFQNRSTDKAKTTEMMNVEEGSSTAISKKEGSASPEPSEAQQKKGMKFGIRVFPPNVNEKLFGKARSKSPPAEIPEVNKQDEVKINMDETDGVKTTEVTIECENFNRHNSITSSGIKRDENGIPQELPAFMANAAMAARDGRKMGSDSEMRKNKGVAPRPPMINVDLDGSTDTMDTNLNLTDTSISNMNANNTNNANMEIEDELDRITEKYLSQSKDKLNFTDNFANSSLLNKTDEGVTLFDQIEDIKDDIDDVILRRKEPSNSSTPKSDRKDLNKSFELDSDLDLSNYGNRMELNSSDVTVHQANEAEDMCDETRRAASLGDLSLMKKSLTQKDGNSMERAQSLDITDNNMMPKQSLALALSKPTADLSVITDANEASPTYQVEPKSPKMEMTNGTNENVNRTDQTKMINYGADTNVPDDIKVIRYPFGSLERPKSDVLKKILGTPTIQKIEIEQEETNKSSTAPSIVFMTPVSNNEGKENVPMTNGNLTSIVTIESQPKEVEDKMTVLSVDTSEPPVSLTFVNNKIEMSDPNGMSPIFSSNNMGINSIKISSVDFKPITVSSTVIKNPPENNYAENYFVKDNVVTISTDSQPSSIQFIDDVKLDFNMQVLDDLEKDDVPLKNDFKPKVIEAEAKIDKEETEFKKVNGNTTDLEINNNVSKTTIMSDDDTQEILSNQQMNKFLTEIVFKGDDSAIEDMTASEETATLTSSTMSNSSSEDSSPNVMTSTKTMTLTNVPLSTANFLKNERRHVEKNFVPQNSEIKFTTAVYENSTSNLLANHNYQKEPQKRMSQIEQIRQNFEKSAQTASEIPAPIPVARRSSIPLSIQNQKTTPSKIPVFNKQTSKISPNSRTNSYSKLNSSTDSLL